MSEIEEKATEVPERKVSEQEITEQEADSLGAAEAAFSKECAQTENAAKNRHENIWLAKVGLMIFLTFSCCVLIFFAVYRYRDFANSWGKIMKIAQPIIMGLVLAYLLNPVMRSVERGCLRLFGSRMKSEQKAEKFARMLGIVAAIVFLIFVITVLIMMVVPGLINSISSLVDSGSGYMVHFLDLLDQGILGHFEVTEVVAKYLTMLAGYVQDWAETELLPQVQNYVAQVTGGVISALKALLNFIIGIIVAVYVMMIKEQLVGQSKKLVFAVFRPRNANIIVEIARKANEVFGGFIIGKLIDSAIIGVIAYIGCAILKIPDALLVSVIIGVTNIIPVFGPFIGAVPCLLIVVIQSPWHALYLLIFIVVLQQVDGNIIGPKILGNSTGLSSFWVMFAILIGGGLFGFLGMLLGIPIFAMLYYILRRLVNYGLRKRRLPESTESYVKASAVDIDAHALVYEDAPKKKKRR